ncbi:hypothetical protein QBC39DRAFT_157452 [Podospora conica]|nr:hypothetical protein QBC39DRAFT_157452 [Schizothecium conicum]
MSSSSNSPRDTVMVSDPRADPEQTGETGAARGNSSVPKPKRLACMICRKRKLKCDGIKPSCSTCSRLGHTCAYDEVRRKSGPKRGYVKALEERLKQVETLLKTQDPSTSPDGSKGLPIPVDGAAAKQPANQRAAATANFSVQDPSIGIAKDRDMDRWHFNGDSPNNVPLDDFNFNNINIGLGNGDNFTWEMIGLGLEEPLPPQDTIDELHQIYFEKIHPSLPMIHKYRYLAAMNLAPNQRPPVCLRYAMWTLACSVNDKYLGMKDLFYQRARKYVESDYIKGYGEHMISVAHAQTHVLLASYEFKWMYFPRAWMSTGSAVRLCQMIGLHRLDGEGLDVKQCLPPPRDWTEKEERRRTFWMAFCQDRYASIGTGWPMTVDEKDILTNLPASDDAFDLSRPEETPPLHESMSPSGAGKLSAFGGIVLLACLFGRNLVHLHRPDVDDRDHDLNGEFWKRHRNMDNILLNTSLCLPSHLKLPNGLGNPNIVFTNMCIHTSTICLHQAAIFKADKNRLPASVSAESKVRCITAANEIASIMRMISHLDLATMNPFISFCLYVSARVFVQYLKSRPDDSQTSDSLRFLLSAMNALRKRNPLTESFLVQLDVDLEALGQRIPKLKAAFPRSTDSPGPGFSNPQGFGGTKPIEGEGRGSMPYSNECVFLKMAGDDGNPVNAPDLVDLDPSLTSNNNTTSQTPSSTGGLPSQSWSSSAEPGSLPTRERGSGSGSSYVPVHAMMPDFGRVDVDSTGTTSLDEGRPTPNSSTAASDHLVAPGGGRVSGRASFEASPVASHPSMPGRATRGVSEFFADPSAYSLPPDVTAGAQQQRYGLADASGGFGSPAGWSDLQGQPAMADGVLRSILAMGPMDTMDLRWDSNQ